MHRQNQLLDIVLAASAVGRLTSFLHGRKQNGHKDRNDGDHNEQLNQSEACAFVDEEYA